jgi:hypothetical protein
MGSGIQTIGANITQVDTTPMATPGGSLAISNENWYMYFKATGSLSVGQLIALDINGAAAAGAVTAALVYTAGIVMSNMTNGQYGWMFRMGPSCSVLAATLAVVGVPLFTTAVPGVVDDAATAGVIRGLRLNATVGGAQALTVCSSGSLITING